MSGAQLDDFNHWVVIHTSAGGKLMLLSASIVCWVQ